MGRSTTAQVKNKDFTVALAQHDTDAPVLPMDQIERLKEILPDKVDWVFIEAAKEGTFRRDETRRVNTFVALERLGGILVGFLIGCVALFISGFLAIKGHDTVAAIVGGTTVIGLVTAFATGQRKPSTNANNFPPPRR